MKIPLLLFASVVAALQLVPAQAPAADELTFKEYQELHQKIRPAPDEAYLTIPWKISLVEAQRIAAREGKPIFIWAMDGHPLGCT